MISGSRNRAASRYGVDPISVAGRFQSVVSRRSGVPFVDAHVRIGAAREERLHQAQIASQDRRMQRRVAAAERIRIGAVLEQQRGHVAIAAVGGEHEGADAVGLRVVRVGAGLRAAACADSTSPTRAANSSGVAPPRSTV